MIGDRDDIGDLHIGVRAYNILKHKGIDRVSDIPRGGELRALRGVGQKLAGEIEAAIDRYEAEHLAPKARANRAALDDRRLVDAGITIMSSALADIRQAQDAEDVERVESTLARMRLLSEVLPLPETVRSSCRNTARRIGDNWCRNRPRLAVV